MKKIYIFRRTDEISCVDNLCPLGGSRNASDAFQTSYEEEGLLLRYAAATQCTGRAASTQVVTSFFCFTVV